MPRHETAGGFEHVDAITISGSRLLVTEDACVIRQTVSWTPALALLIIVSVGSWVWIDRPWIDSYTGLMAIFLLVLSSLAIVGLDYVEELSFSHIDHVSPRAWALGESSVGASRSHCYTLSLGECVFTGPPRLLCCLPRRSPCLSGRVSPRWLVPEQEGFEFESGVFQVSGREAAPRPGCLNSWRSGVVPLFSTNSMVSFRTM